MDLLSHLPLAIALVLASLWLYILWRSRTHSHKIKSRSPPEPPGAWPIIGHLHLISSQAPLARTLGAMADKYGPVLSFRLGVHPVLVNLILAGSDTTSINLTWVLSILLNNRPALTRAQEEIDTQIGKTRWVEERDVKSLVYLQAIVKETLRLYPPGPLSIPHQATADCEIGGYNIPKGTRVFPNVWKLHRDPRVRPDPEEFVPERWLAGNHAAGVDVSGKNFELSPFGSSRRSCPGTTVAMQVTQLTLARLIQGFELATPGNEAVDMSEGLGMTLPKVKPLEVVITPRLSSDLYEG
ncbi:hypothetical protein RHSIM_Rhsim01G0216500 [Rhododendron simsii]|uniref:Cytochrome P450 n=1 Tax=Rhododendron simsii TaxID=118357 RepID=A0A834HRM1_RHOSS|nr:hypothetical protein RHSIM_Rhsim01G0216500 [Rhododendron simsii]